MSELIFPSQILIPAQWNTENAIANTLIANGVEIYLTTDDLVSVLGIVNDAIGVATDITNNELGELSNGYRMGADISSLTVEDQVDVIANPYQIFKTEDDVRQEYGLKLSTTTEQMSIPFTGAYDIDLTDSDGAVTNYTGTDTFTLDGTTPVLIKIISGTHNTDVREIFDFNQSHSDNVKSHTSSLVCTLSGLPVDSGYIVENNEIIGCQFTTTTTATLLLTGAYTGTTTYFDGSILPISGSGNHIVNTGVVKTIEVTDTVNTYLFDGTTGDDDSLIELNHNNHAAITNVGTTKWQPILPRDVFYAKADGSKDYIDATSFFNAQGIDGRISELVMLGEFTGVQHFGYNNYVGAYIVHGEVTPTGGNWDELTKVKTAVDASYAFSFPEGAYGGIELYDLGLEGTENHRILYAPASVDKAFLLKQLDIRYSEGVAVTENYAVYLRNNSGNPEQLVLRDSFINNPSSGLYGVLCSVNKGVLENNVIVGDNASYAVGSAGFLATNNVVKGEFQNTTTGSNNISSGTSATDLGIGTGSVPFTNAFVDEALNDYRINQAWADTNLVGKGWNGSDIASFAYYVDTATSSEQAIIVISAQQLTQTQVIAASGVQSVDVITVQALTQSQLVGIHTAKEIVIINAEQHTQSVLSAIATINNPSVVITEQLTQNIKSNANDEQLITAVQSQQLTSVLAVNVTSSDSQEISVVVSEQKVQSQTLSASELQAIQLVISEQITQNINSEIIQGSTLSAITCDQVTEAVTVNVDEYSGIFVSVVQTEQFTQAAAANIDVSAIANAVITEQLTQYATQQINVDLTVSPLVSEQLTQAQLIEIIESNIANELNIDIDQITLELLTPTYSIELLTPTYTIKHIH